MENSVVEYVTLVTLTYPASWPDVRASKEHLRVFARWLLRSSGATSVLWVLEWQARGAPHYHLLVDAAWIPCRDVARAWHRATAGLASVVAGTRTERLRCGRLEIGSYMSKLVVEITKMSQKQAPGVWTGRYWGVYGDRSMHSVSASESILPRQILLGVLWQAQSASPVHVRLPGVLWVRWSAE